MREKLGAKKPLSLMLRMHAQTAGVSLTAQQPYNNVVRTWASRLETSIPLKETRARPERARQMNQEKNQTHPAPNPRRKLGLLLMLSARTLWLFGAALFFSFAPRRDQPL